MFIAEVTMDAYTGPELERAIFDFYILATGIPASQPDRALLKYRFQTINRWRRTLLRDIEFCCACELRHINDGTASPKEGSWEAWFKEEFGKVGNLWYQKFHKMATDAGMIPPFSDHGLPLDQVEDMASILEGNQNNSSSRIRSYVAAKLAEGAHGLSLIEVSEKAFDPKKVYWDSSYGGKKWYEIAKCLYELWNAKDMKTIVECIDRAFALHHNCNVVFTKNSIWSKHGHGWILKALDKKWAAMSPHSLLGLCSETLRDLVTAVGDSSAPVPLSAFQFASQIAAGVSVTLPYNVEAVVKKIWDNGMFRSIQVNSPHFKAIKTAKGSIKYRIYSMEELLRGLEGVNVSGSPSLPVPPDDEKEAPVPDSLSKFVLGVQGVHGNLLTVVAESFSLGLGGCYAQDGVARFQLKGSTPLRFYFVFHEDADRIELKVGKTKENNLGEAKQHKLYKYKELPLGLSWEGDPVTDIKQIIAKHVGAIL
jgi:hypothetical protein